MTSSHDYIRTLPSWTGTTFTSKLHTTVPPSLSPTLQTLPSGFVVLITGASRSIGRATALTFARVPGVAGLILTGRSESELSTTEKLCEEAAAVVASSSSPLKISTVSADISLESTAVRLAELIKSEYAGRLDLLVNNAAFFASSPSAFGALAEVSPEQISGAMETNFYGRVFLIKHLLPFLFASEGEEGRKGGAIVNISSVGSLLTSMAPLGYSISALATNRLTERVAEEYGNKGVLSFAVHPGTVLTESHFERMPWVEEMTRGIESDSEFLCGAFLVWLVRERREWLSGRYLDATWDVEELEGRREEIVEGGKLKMRLVV